MSNEILNTKGLVLAKKKTRSTTKTLGKYGPPGKIKYRPPEDGNKRSALERAARLPKLSKGQTRR
jgi:hypothetical protein